MKPFAMVELAIKELIERDLEGVEPDDNRVGGDLSYRAGNPFYVWFGLIPGGFTDELEGNWVVDIDVFDDDYTDAMNKALELESVMIGPMKRTSIMNIDRCTQNEGPAERPTEDDKVFRIGATYVFTARRSA